MSALGMDGYMCGRCLCAQSCESKCEAHTRIPVVDVWCRPPLLSTLFKEPGSHRLTALASQFAQGIFSLCHLSTGITGGLPHLSSFMWVPGIHKHFRDQVFLNFEFELSELQPYMVQPSLTAPNSKVVLCCVPSGVR